MPTFPVIRNFFNGPILLGEAGAEVDGGSFTDSKAIMCNCFGKGEEAIPLTFFHCPSLKHTCSYLITVMYCFKTIHVCNSHTEDCFFSAMFYDI